MAAERLAILGNQAFSLFNFRGPLIADFVARGLKVFAFAPDHDDVSRKEVRALGATPVDYNLDRTGMNPIRDVANAAGLTRRLRKLRPDICFSYAVKPVVYGMLAARWAGVPHRYALVNGLGYAFIDDGSKNPRKVLVGSAVRRLYKLALARTDRVFIQNEGDLDDLVRWGIVEPEKAIRVYGTGVDLDQWTVAAPAEKPITFLMAARLLREKGVTEFVEAARKLKKWRSDVRFILLGGLDSNPSGIAEGEVRDWLEEKIIEWPGHVPVKPWLAQTSVYVLPTFYREGVPRSIQEAMAMGRPIITTDMPGCRDTVEEGRTGFLVPPRDVESLVAAMRRFVEEPDLIPKMGKESRRLAEERFDVRKINRQMIETMGFDT